LATNALRSTRIGVGQRLAIPAYRVQVMDNRAAPRVQVRIPGKVMWSNGACGKLCTITDLSEGGAQINTTVFTEVPKIVNLFEARSGSLFECEVRWQQGPLIGLQFLDFCSRAKRRELIERHGLGQLPGAR
jgi:hypothetical protein